MIDKAPPQTDGHKLVIKKELSAPFLLDEIKSPTDLKSRSLDELARIADEVRNQIIDVVSKTGGHLGAGLGVVELAVALHHVFDTPNDKLIWDVGHQCYPHKILTGRKDRLHTLRQKGGLSGFTNRSESEYDPFGAGHSSTSISAGVGMAVARDLQKSDNHVVSVIGDGSMGAGMAFEALNHGGSLGSRMTVILNDNDMAIAPPVGALSTYLSRLISSKPYMSLRQVAMEMASRFPNILERTARRAEEYARGLVTGGTLFEELGFFYIGPIDGHRLDHLVPILNNIRNMEEGVPILLHVVTKKGRGYLPAEESAEKYHGVTSFNVSTGAFAPSSNLPTYTDVFADTLIAAAEEDEKIVAVNAAMPAGTGLDRFADRFPERCFDVGIAEQHAVTFAAGLAAEGMKPVTAIYSSFLQRAYDQVVHDVALQKLPVRFAVDRAGFVGADGATHHGAFDVAFLSNVPNMLVMGAADGNELVRMVRTALATDDLPTSFRYPRGMCPLDEKIEDLSPLKIGKGRIVKKGKDVAILSFGGRLQASLKAAEQLEKDGISVTVADARFLRPLDEKLIRDLAKNHEALITIEEGVQGGFGSAVLHFMAHEGLLDGRLKVRSLTMPDRFIEHDTMDAQYALIGMDADGIAATVKELAG